MSHIPSGSIHLIVSFPDLGEDIDAVFPFLKSALNEMFRVLVVGGRVCLVVKDAEGVMSVPWYAHIVSYMDSIGFDYRTTIIWDRQARLEWGKNINSWRSPKDPQVRNSHSYVLVMNKNSSYRKEPNDSSMVLKEYYIRDTESIYRIAESNTSYDGKPNRAKIELAKRLVRIYSFKGDVVLDPFVTCASVLVSSELLKRKWVGYQKYYDIIENAYKVIDFYRRLVIL